MADLELVRSLAAEDHNLAVLAVSRADGGAHASVVSLGVIDDPVDGAPGVGAVVAGDARKLPLLRAGRQATAVVKHGWRWAAVSGPVRLVGPEDRDRPELDVLATIRSVFVAAGGTHEDWAEFDRTMERERRCAVFIRADAVTANPGA